MNGPEQRLAELGLSVPEMVRPMAAYVPTVRSGAFERANLEATKLARTGKLGAEVSTDQGRELAQQCALNALAAIKAEVGDLASVKRVVKVVGFVASAPEYYDQPEVINGASELLGAVFGEAGKHARSAVGVAVLPRNAPVEVEVIVEV